MSDLAAEVRSGTCHGKCNSVPLLLVIEGKGVRIQVLPQQCDLSGGIMQTRAQMLSVRGISYRGLQEKSGFLQPLGYLHIHLREWNELKDWVD